MAGRSEAPHQILSYTTSKKTEETQKRKMSEEGSEDSEAEMQTDGFILSKTKKRNVKEKVPVTESSNTIYAVPVKNRWGAFTQTADADDANPSTQASEETPKKKLWIPPVIIPGTLDDYKMMCDTIKKVTGNDNFRIYANSKETKIQVFTEEDRNKLTAGLKTDDVPHHTYATRNERTKKIVLKAAPNMDVQEIRDELAQKGLLIKNCTKLKSKNPYSFSYLITTDITENLNNIKKVSNIGYCKAKWETFNKSRRYTQCFRCQQFGHGALHCNYLYRCVKCGENHPTADCKLQKEEKPKCANCKGEHPANYGRCPALEEYLSKKLESAKSRARDNKTPRQFSSNFVRPGVNYNKAVSQTEHTNDTSRKISTQKNDGNDLQQLSSIMTEISEMCNIKQMLQLLSEASVRLKSCKNNIEKMLVIAELCENLNE